MYLTNLKLKNFRNYDEEEIKFINGINLFIGNNAQGKTNIIESIYISSFGKSYRTQKNNEVINFNKDYSRINLEFYKKDISNLDIYIDKKIKSIKLDSIKINKISDLIGQELVVIFSPEDLEIVKGSPNNRRRFIDSICSILSKSYLLNLQEYNKCLQLKNSYLKNNNEIEYLKVLHEKMSKNIFKICNFRNEIISKLLRYVKIINNEITENKENIELKYESEFLNLSLKKIEELLNNNIKSDLLRRTATKGIQRDDLKIIINNYDVNKYGSQGQKRTSLLCLKIASFELIKEIKNETPILLLDDIMSELDSKRIEYLLNYIKNYQSVITTTNINFNIKDINIKINKIVQGNLQKI